MASGADGGSTAGGGDGQKLPSRYLFGRRIRGYRLLWWTAVLLAASVPLSLQSKVRGAPRPPRPAPCCTPANAKENGAKRARVGPPAARRWGTRRPGKL